MQNLTFKLNGIVKGKNEQENFEGPLNLILQLLSKNKIEIRDIQIALILDQYLEYLDKMEQMDLDIASEFVTMAAHLVYIKTRMLLDSEEEIDELDQLIGSLEMLKCKGINLQIKGIAETFKILYENGSRLHVKPREALPKMHDYQYTHDKGELVDAIKRVLSRGEGDSGLVYSGGIVIPKTVVYSVTEKSEEIMELLRDHRNVKIRELFRAAKSRTELVAAFLSVLELCKSGGIILTDDNDEIIATGGGTFTRGDTAPNTEEELQNG